MSSNVDHIKTKIQVSKSIGTAVNKIQNHASRRCNQTISRSNWQCRRHHHWQSFFCRLKCFLFGEKFWTARPGVFSNVRSTAESINLYWRVLPDKIDSVEVYTITSISCFATSAKIVCVPSKFIRCNLLFFAVHKSDWPPSDRREPLLGLCEWSQCHKLNRAPLPHWKLKAHLAIPEP